MRYEQLGQVFKAKLLTVSISVGGSDPPVSEDPPTLAVNRRRTHGLRILCCPACYVALCWQSLGLLSGLVSLLWKDIV